MTHAISKAEAFQVIGFNKDNTQHRLCSARTLPALLTAWTSEVERHAASGPHNILPTFKRIMVWSVEGGFTGLELPYIPTTGYAPDDCPLCHGAGVMFNVPCMFECDYYKR
jgi:hypothetical protein